MRKDVKRSLLLWPSAAAATITLLAGWSTSIEIAPQADPSAAVPPALGLPVPPTAAEITVHEPAARYEQGRRAVALPPRVAAMLEQALAAPTAVAPGVEARDSVAAPDSQRSAGVSLDAPQTPWLAQGIEESTSPWFTGQVVLAPLASVLPQSNRALARPEFASPSLPRTPLAESPQPTSEVATPLDPAAESMFPDRGVRSTVISSAAWPRTAALDDQLNRLTERTFGSDPAHPRTLVSTSPESSQLDQWSHAVSDGLKQLRRLPRLGDPEAGLLIERLDELAGHGVQQAEAARDRDVQVDWLRAAHSLKRRTAVWYPVWEVATRRTATPVDHRPVSVAGGDHDERIADSIHRVRADLHLTADAAGWERFLLLDRIAAAADSPDPTVRSEAALQWLSRLDSPLLHDSHRQWLQRESISVLAAQLKTWVAEVVDYSRLLRQLESYESDSTELSAAEVATAVQALRHCDNPAATNVADAIDVYYRNANLRVAISQRMLERLTPEIPPQTVPVRTSMHGSQIRGTSEIHSDVKVTLIPAPGQWSMQLHTTGTVHTRSRGYRGPIVLRTLGSNGFQVTTPVTVTPSGIDVGQSQGQAEGRVRLQQIESDFDAIPLVGSVVRSYAKYKFEELAPQSSRITNHRIAGEVEHQVDDQLNEQVARATEQFSTLILGPMGRLRLDPTVTDMQTTEDRLIARYRLASHQQLAAGTARPRAPGQSLVSVQVHQSAVNNTLAQLVPQHQPTPIREAITAALATFGGIEPELPEDIPEDVSIQFLPTQPISVEFEDSIVWVTLRVVRLTRDERLQLTKFVVRAAYRAEVDGTSAKLVRDGHLRISGPGMSMRERLPIRAIFNKVLSSSRPLPLTLPAMANHPALAGLEINQLVIDNGWIGLAIGPAYAAVADRQQSVRH